MDFWGFFLGGMRWMGWDVRNSQIVLRLPHLKTVLDMHAWVRGGWMGISRNIGLQAPVSMRPTWTMPKPTPTPGKRHSMSYGHAGWHLVPVCYKRGVLGPNYPPLGVTETTSLRHVRGAISQTRGRRHGGADGRTDGGVSGGR